MTSTVDDTSSTNENGYVFTVTLSNPCKTATLNSPTVSAMTVDDGSSVTQDITDASDSWYTSFGNPTFCGLRTFTVEDTSGNAISWMSVALVSGTTYRITAAPTSTDTELQASYSLVLKVVSDDYSSDVSSITVAFTATVATPACNCALQAWDNGTGVTSSAPVGSTTTVTLALPSVSSGAYTSSPAMRACSANSCATTGSFTSVVMTDDSSLPTWITTASSST